MVRLLRIDYEGAYYHVMNRGRGWQLIFHGDQYRERLLSCLEQAHIRFALECHAHCPNGNHYHLLVRTPRANLARSMRQINGVYTQYYNSLKKTDGLPFRGRYKAINIEASSYLLEVSRYIHRNPVETKKPLVEKLESYRWSSYPAYRSKVRSPDWLYRESVFDELASAQPTAAYRRFVEQGNDEGTEIFYGKNQWPAVRGSKGFIEKAHLRSTTGKNAVRRYREVISAEAILAATARYLNCDKKDLLIARRGRGANNEGRLIAMKLCQELGSMKLSAMAELFDVGSDSAISRAVDHFSQILSTDRRL